MARDDRPRRPVRGGRPGHCVEVDSVVDGRIAVRNSSNPSAGVAFFTRAEMDAWVRGAQSRERARGRESTHGHELDDAS